MRIKNSIIIMLAVMIFTAVFLPFGVLAESTVPTNMGSLIDEAGEGVYGVNDTSAILTLPQTVGAVISVALAGMGMLLSGVVVYGAYLWLSAGGNEDQVKKGRNWIINGIAGIILATSAYLITDYVLIKLEKTTGDIGAVDGTGGATMQTRDEGGES